MPRKSNDEVQIAVMANDISYIKKSVEDINKKITDDFVSKDEFEPVKRLVYGLVSLILITVVGAVLALVIIRP